MYTDLAEQYICIPPLYTRPVYSYDIIELKLTNTTDTSVASIYSICIQPLYTQPLYTASVYSLCIQPLYTTSVYKHCIQLLALKWLYTVTVYITCIQKYTKLCLISFLYTEFSICVTSLSRTPIPIDKWLTPIKYNYVFF